MTDRNDIPGIRQSFKAGWRREKLDRPKLEKGTGKSVALILLNVVGLALLVLALGPFGILAYLVALGGYYLTRDVEEIAINAREQRDERAEKEDDR